LPNIKDGFSLVEKLEIFDAYKVHGRTDRVIPIYPPKLKDGFSLVEKLEIFENLLQNH
jgi:hypothetical protein